MGRAMLAVFMSSLVTAACTSPPAAAQVGESVLIRNEFVVPPGKLLLVDDMSVDCVIASEVLDEQEFPKVGVEAFAGAGATLRGVCHGILVNMINAFITAGSGRLVDAP